MKPGRDGTVRHGTVRWLTDPPHGHARIHVDSDAFTALPLSFPRDEPRPAETTPGELLAAVYSAFMATNLAQRLETDGSPAGELVVDLWCRLSTEVTARSAGRRRHRSLVDRLAHVGQVEASDRRVVRPGVRCLALCGTADVKQCLGQLVDREQEHHLG
jgi:hypothetical protein